MELIHKRPAEEEGKTSQPFRTWSTQASGRSEEVLLLFSVSHEFYFQIPERTQTVGMSRGCPFPTAAYGHIPDRPL